MRTTQRLSATLRRLLDSRSAADRQRLSQLLAEIRSLAAAQAELPPEETVGIEIDTGIPLALPLSRAFWSTPATFETVDLTEHEVDDEKRLEAFRILAGMHRLDWRSIRQHIAEITGQKGSATIGQIIEKYPPQVGIVELLAYLQIARDDGHVISRQNTETVLVLTQDASQPDFQVILPLVYFVAPQQKVAHV